MRSWIRIVLGILLIAVLGGLFWQATRQREPVYKGRRLSVWMKYWRNGYDPALQSATREAVRAMGTNTIPYVRADTNHYVRGAAKLALKQIDTEAASRAGAK